MSASPFSSVAPYGVAAILCVSALVGVLFHLGANPYAAQGHGQASSFAATYDEFEIVYFGNRDCKWCTEWRQYHLPKWRRQPLSKRVRITLRRDDCLGEGRYASICEQVFAQTNQVPAFALVHTPSDRILTIAVGIEGFYDVRRDARRWTDFRLATG